MVVSAASAAVASFSGLRGLADASGWAPELAWLLPVTVDAYATTSARVWLAASTISPAARRFARTNALGAITVSIAGNAVYHAAETGLLTITWPIVVAVGAIPAAVLGLTAHLHALRSRPAPTTDEPPADPSTDPPALPVPADPGWPTRHVPGPERSDADLFAAARLADTRYRTEHNDRPITRDALRAALHVSARRATELRRRLTAEPAVPDAVPAGPDPVPALPAPERKETHNAHDQHS
ncbi:DUF2637 domain-containing protein [Cryptosporangium sp. NPDC051539]|uniref:DUF2637 domain-containing protein n=1 Tax=Cryptosporangium sp. NPDC051539 TaxID=3363962 RepID=UPI0037937AAF